MSPVQACPSPQTLTDYLLGRLNEAEWQSICDHLHTCDVCVSHLDQVDESQDSMIRHLRRPESNDPFLQEPECRLAVEKSRQLDWGRVAELGVLRDYQLIEKLGEGGMGAVYRARHTKLDREVAVKLLSSDRLRSARAVSRFEREMKAIGRLHHPHIVQAFDAGEVEGQYYLVMELVSGLDLSAVVDRVGPLPLADACEIVRQVALGLQHAHEHDLVHRDIKPSNLMLTPAGDVKLLDLGRARLQDPLSDEHAVTSSGQVMGTLDYMAPEQLGDSHAVDKAAIRCHRN
jgi:serine/threonine protein kinase